LAGNRTLNGAPAAAFGRKKTKIVDFGAPMRCLIGGEREVPAAPAMEKRESG